jgi:hypothetical protein
MYVVHHKQYSIPLGFCWGVGFRTQTGTRFESYGRFTPDWARRSGVQAFINKRLFEAYDVISTCSGTKLGEKFLKSSGYKYDLNIQTWYKKKEKQ